MEFFKNTTKSAYAPIIRLKFFFLHFFLYNISSCTIFDFFSKILYLSNYSIFSRNALNITMFGVYFQDYVIAIVLKQFLYSLNFFFFFHNDELDQTQIRI